MSLATYLSFERRRLIPPPSLGDLSLIKSRLTYSGGPDDIELEGDEGALGLNGLNFVSISLSMLCRA